MSGRTNDTVSGAREGGLSGLRRLFARATARDLAALVVPGPDVARALGLDLEAVGLSLAPGPRQASVLVVLGPPAGLSEDLERAAEVAYAQMSRPRSTLIVGIEATGSLPTGARCEPGQESLVAAVGSLRRAFRDGAFSGSVEDFEASALEAGTIYTCSMHPEIEQDEPGQCPECGMDLIPRQVSGGDSRTQHDHASHEDQGQDEGEHDGHSGHKAEASGEGTGHDGQDQDAGDGQSGAEGGEHHEAGSGHGGHEDMDFMSMVEMTEGTPRSSDGLQMEWVEAPFGPLLPGLPGGLSLSFTLDGDTVAEAVVETATASANDLLYGPVSGLVTRLSGLDPLSPFSYGLLASLALTDVRGEAAAEGESLHRIARIEVERAASHLGWLSGFAHLNGLEPVSREAARLELRLRLLPKEPLELEHLSADLLEAAARLSRSIDRTPLLSRRLYGVGVLEAPDTEMGGPVARAAGRRDDLRLESADYGSLGFEPVLNDASDALSRLRVRLAELHQSLRLAQDALRRATGTGPMAAYGSVAGSAAGSGSAAVETPRGPATLWLSVEEGEIAEAELILPVQEALVLAKNVAEGRELGDALVGIASLDISPWGAG